MSIKTIIRKNKLSSSICLFLILMFLVHLLKPAFVYNKDGSFRPFGIGNTNTTIIPIWLVVIFLSIVSYLVVHYFVLVF